MRAVNLLKSLRYSRIMKARRVQNMKKPVDTAALTTSRRNPRRVSRSSQMPAIATARFS